MKPMAFAAGEWPYVFSIRSSPRTPEISPEPLSLRETGESRDAVVEEIKTASVFHAKRSRRQRLCPNGALFSECQPNDQPGLTGVVNGAHVTSRDDNPPASRKSSIFLGRMVSLMFMGVNLRCAHQVRPPAGRSEALRGR